MSRPASPCDIIPAQTIPVARAAFPRGKPAMRRRDALGPLYTPPTFAALFSPPGRPADAPAQLALLTVRQCAAGLSDAQAADAVRARMDWQDALALEVTDPGCDASGLSAFRQRLLTGQAELLLFETMWTLVRAPGLLKAKGRQRPASTHVLAAIQPRKRLECVGEPRRQALTGLATAAPAWLPSWVPAAWFDRSSQRFADYRLLPARPARSALAEHIGTDGRQVLEAIYDPATPGWLRERPAIQPLRQGGLQQLSARPQDQPVRWRSAQDLPPAPVLSSAPSAPEARYGTKREAAGTGDKGHRTETCDDETPNLSTDVTPPPATTSAWAMLPTMQAQLATRQLTPREQIVDVGSVTSDHLWTSRPDPGIDLRGPTMSEQSGHGPAGHGCAAAPCVIAWDAKDALGPQGQRSVVWMERPACHGHPTVRIAGRKPVCGACARRADCPRAAPAPRALRIRERAQYIARQTARVRQQTEAFKHTEARRASIEGTIAQGPRPGDLRRARSSGLVKTRLLHLLLAAAINCRRVAAWLAEIPRARTRPSAFAALAA